MQRVDEAGERSDVARRWQGTTPAETRVRALPVWRDDGLVRSVRIRCPGCDRSHVVRVAWAPDEEPNTPLWTFNGDFIWPTITPDVCTLIEAMPLPDGSTLPRQFCRFRVTEGRIAYHPDCTHAMRGHTVTIPLVLMPPRDVARWTGTDAAEDACVANADPESGK